MSISYDRRNNQVVWRMDPGEALLLAKALDSDDGDCDPSMRMWPEVADLMDAWRKAGKNG